MGEKIAVDTLPDDLETCENRINAAVADFCMDHDIVSLKKESQSVFVACLTYVYRRVFKPSKTFIGNRKSLIDYENSPDVLLGIMDYYIYLCELNEKAVSMYDFSKLIGVDYSTLFEWSLRNDILDNKASLKRSNIRKRLTEEREQSLIHKLEDGKNQAVSYIAVLNRQFGWSLPGVSREEVKPVLTRNELLKGLDALPEKPVGIESSDD